MSNRRKCFWWFPIRFTSYEIVKNHDDYELVIKSGLLNNREEKLKLFKVNDISYHRSLGNFLFAQGNITLSTSESGSRYVEISKIQGYKEFGKELEELAYKERERVKVSYTETNVIR